MQYDLELRDITFGSSSWHILGLRSTIVWNILKIQRISSETLRSGQGFNQYMYTVTLTLEIWHLVNVMTDRWVKVNSHNKCYHSPTLAVWSYSQDNDFSYVCTGVADDNSEKNMDIQHRSSELWPGQKYSYVCSVALTLEILPWFKFMTHPWCMDKNNVWNIIQIQLYSRKLWLGQCNCGQKTDRRAWTMVIPIFPPMTLRGG